MQQPSMMSRGPSPYNPPPSAVPPSNRYAPTLTPRQETPSLGTGNPSGPPPPNPYTSRTNYPSAQPQPPNERVGKPLPSNGPPPRDLGPPPAASGGLGPEATQIQQGAESSPTPRNKHRKSSRYLSLNTGSESWFAKVSIAPGDRSHIPANSRPIYELLSTDMQRVKARAPPNFQKHVNDTEKRLNILYDHLNNQDLLKDDTVESMVQLSQALQARDYEQAQGIHLELLTNKTDQCGQWMVGIPTDCLENAITDGSSPL